MTLASHYVGPAVRMKDLLDMHKQQLEIDQVFYGDQVMIPSGVTACVEGGPIRATLAGSSNMTLNSITTYVLIYVSKIDSEINNRLRADNTGKSVQHFFQQNLQLADDNGNDPIIIHGFFEEIDPGYTIRQNTLFESVKMTWTSTTKTMLSQ